MQKKIDRYLRAGVKPNDFFDYCKEDCMYQVLQAKYECCSEFRHTLMATGDTELMFASGHPFLVLAPMVKVLEC